MIRACAGFLGIFFLLCSPVRAGDFAGLLDRFEGEWTSNGPAFGGEAASTMIWAPTLNTKFFRLDYSVAVTREDGAGFAFKGIAHYQLGDEESLSAYWADNSGDLHPIHAERDGDALVAHWGVDGAKQGRTRYELLPSGEIDVTDWIRTTEGWRQFNRNRFVKRAVE